MTPERDLAIRSERLLLRRFAVSDVPAILGLSAADDVRAAAAELGTTESQATAYVRTQDALTPFQLDGLFDLAIERVEDGSVVGMLTLVRRVGHGEVGYALRRDARGDGVATEAAAALVRHAFEVLGLPAVIVETAAVNRGARGVAERLGMDLVTTYRDHGVPSVRYLLDVAAWRASEARTPRRRRSGKHRPRR